MNSPVESCGKSQLQIHLQSILRPPKGGRIYLNPLVGAARFELTTPCAQGRCATRLRYAPTIIDCSSARPSCYPYTQVLVEERGPPVTRRAIPGIRSAGRKGQPRRNRRAGSFALRLG